MDKLDQLEFEKKLNKRQKQVYGIMKRMPALRHIQNTNLLVRMFWQLHGDVSCESITRVARWIRSNGVFDTEENADARGHLEQAYRNVNKEVDRMTNS